MKLQKVNTSDDNAHRKMVHIHSDVHLELQRLSIKTGIPINKLVEMLLRDALSRIELVENEDKTENEEKDI